MARNALGLLISLSSVRNHSSPQPSIVIDVCQRACPLSRSLLMNAMRAASTHDLPMPQLSATRSVAASTAPSNAFGNSVSVSGSILSS